jgi:hypothetical protein
VVGRLSYQTRTWWIRESGMLAIVLLRCNIANRVSLVRLASTARNAGSSRSRFESSHVNDLQLSQLIVGRVIVLHVFERLLLHSLMHTAHTFRACSPTCPVEQRLVKDGQPSLHLFLPSF